MCIRDSPETVQARPCLGVHSAMAGLRQQLRILARVRPAAGTEDELAYMPDAVVSAWGTRGRVEGLTAPCHTKAPRASDTA
eukprot:9031911-Pyramimonas_sp.AAC.1